MNDHNPLRIVGQALRLPSGKASPLPSGGAESSRRRCRLRQRVRVRDRSWCVSLADSPLPSGERVRVRVSHIGQALRLPLPIRFTLPPIALLLSILFLTTACSTTAPRVIEVSSQTHLQDIDGVDLREYYGYDQASLFRYQPQDLSIEDQREEFYVRWRPASISLVKFEYRQVAKAAVIFEKTYTPHGDMAKLFQVRGEEFRSGGSVSAWRVTLWNGDQLVAEKKSILW
jgi:hypothetical protein